MAPWGSELEKALGKFSESVENMAYSSNSRYDGKLASMSTKTISFSRSPLDVEMDLAQKVHDHAKHYVAAVTDNGRRSTLVAYHNRGGVWELTLDTGQIVTYVSPYASNNYSVVEKALQVTFDGCMYEHRQSYAMRYAQRPQRSYDYQELYELGKNMSWGGVDVGPGTSTAGGSGGTAGAINASSLKVDPYAREVNDDWGGEKKEEPRFKKPDFNYDSSERTAVGKAEFKTCKMCKSVVGQGCDGVINFLGRCSARDKLLWSKVRKLYWHRYLQQKKELALA